MVDSRGAAMVDQREARDSHASSAVLSSTHMGPELKKKIVETLESLPDDATVEDAMERLYFLAKIERGLAESQAGAGMSHEDVKKRFSR